MLRKVESQIALAVNARMKLVSVSNAISNTLIISVLYTGKRVCDAP